MDKEDEEDRKEVIEENERLFSKLDSLIDYLTEDYEKNKNS